MAEKVVRPGGWKGELIETDANVIVHEYEDQAQFEATLALMSEQGWKVQTVTERRSRAGLLRILSLGIMSLVFPPKPRLMVTYVYNEDDPQRRKRVRRG